MGRTLGKICIKNQQSTMMTLRLKRILLNATFLGPDMQGGWERWLAGWAPRHHHNPQTQLPALVLTMVAATEVESLANTAVILPVGECKPESQLPCSCLRRTFMDPPDKLPMPATASNRKALEKYIRKQYKTSAFNTCKRQHLHVTAETPMQVHPP